MRFLGLALAVALVAGCGGGKDGTTTAATSTSTSTPAAADSTTVTTAAETTTTAVAGGTSTTADAPGPAPDMSGEEICTRLPDTVVATALGVDRVSPSAGTTGTPQCSYRFETAGGQPTDATVAALRSEADMGGRSGADAYDFVVSLNEAAAQDTVTETPLGFGDQSVLLTGRRLYMAVLQLGGRIVTVLLGTDAGDAAAVTELARAASVVLAP